MRVRADALVGVLGSVMISPCRFELTVFHGITPTYGEVLGLEASLKPPVQGQGGIHPAEATADDDDVDALARFHVTQIGQTQAPGFSVWATLNAFRTASGTTSGRTSCALPFTAGRQREVRSRD